MAPLQVSPALRQLSRMVARRLIVPALLASILIPAMIGFLGMPYGLTAPRFGGTISITLVGMIMPVALLTLSQPRSREPEGDKRAGR